MREVSTCNGGSADVSHGRAPHAHTWPDRERSSETEGEWDGCWALLSTEAAGDSKAKLQTITIAAALRDAAGMFTTALVGER